MEAEILRTTITAINIEIKEVQAELVDHLLAQGGSALLDYLPIVVAEQFANKDTSHISRNELFGKALRFKELKKEVGRTPPVSKSETWLENHYHDTCFKLGELVEAKDRLRKLMTPEERAEDEGLIDPALLEEAT